MIAPPRDDSSLGTEGESRLVSVVIPCFNQARYLAEAIRSVLSQTHREREILVVDDGSEDDTRGVAESFPEVRYLRQENGGTASARNLGFQESRGAFVLFLDADDRLLAGALRVAVRSLMDCSTCGFTYGHVRLIGPDGSVLETPPQDPVQSDHYLHLLRHNYIWTPGAVLYRRAAVLEVGGFRADAEGSADLDLNLRISRRWAVSCHGTIVLEYREHGESQSANAAAMLRSSVRVRLAQREFLDGRREQLAALEAGIREARAYYGRRTLGSLAMHFHTHRWASALRELLALARYDPRRLLQQAFVKFR